MTTTPPRDQTTRHYYCPSCRHEVIVATQGRTPSPIKWADGHTCFFIPCFFIPIFSSLIGAKR